MLDIGWQELIVIGVLALLVVGPKELPKMLRTLGQYAGKARSMAREFQRSMDEAAREADLDEFKRIREVKRDFEKSTRLDFSEQAKRTQASLTGGSKPNGGAAARPSTPAAETPPPKAEAPAPKAEAPEAPTAPEPAPPAERRES